MKTTLRPHQELAISMLRQSLRSGAKRPILQMPTGAGKTLTAAQIIDNAIARQSKRGELNRVCFAVPSISLIDQTVQALYHEGITGVGVIQADHHMTDPSKQVQVASIQSLMNRNVNRMEFDLVLVDEAHVHYKFMAKWMSDWSNVPFIGLSATPWTKGLGKHWDDLLIPITMQELIDQGYLSPFKVFAPSHPDLTGVRTVAGDYQQNQLSTVMQDHLLVADIVATWKAQGPGEKTLAFCVDRAHAQRVQQEFVQAGIACGYVDAYTSREERQDIGVALGRGELKVVTSVGCLTTGVDWDVRCIILARPTKSEMLFVQIVGRGLRTAPGKDYCLILDHSDTHLRLGFVTDIHHAELNDGERTESEAATKDREEPLPKECSKCHYLKPPKMHICPNCGFVPQKQSDVEVAAGELRELEMNLSAAEKRKRKANRETTLAEKESIYGGLKAIAGERNYKPTWADAQYREKFGVWPNAVKHAPECNPSPELRSWVKSQMIRYAKGRAKA